MSGPKITHRRPRVPGPERRKSILAALEQILATTPLLQVTVKQVVREAQCPMGTFYQQFDDIADAAAALVEARYAEGAPNIAEPHLAAIADLFSIERQLFAA